MSTRASDLVDALIECLVCEGYVGTPITDSRASIDFSSIAVPDINSHSEWRGHPLVEYMRDLTNAGALSLPFPVFAALLPTVTEGIAEAVLVSSTSPDRVSLSYFTRRVGRERWNFVGMWDWFDFLDDDAEVRNRTLLNVGSIQAASRSTDPEIARNAAAALNTAVGGIKGKAVFCVGLLHSERSVNMVRGKRDQKYDALRAARHKSRRPDRIVVTLRPLQETTRTDASGASTGTHASPAPHWRRGHVRRCASGKVVAISPMLINVRRYADIAPANYVVKD